IVFVTPENANSEWLNFEAGAMYASLDKSLLPILVGIEKTNYSGPLKNIQLTEISNRDDVLKLLQTLNKSCDEPLAD
ncbi:hypothetical protein, partial [Leifsonia sp. SIMBA_070]|uniref:hypothetical protein n=1 Tax=Leifsonia sp. SIMBA_070 TaxID=3085810 RepID=UPI00397B9A3B